MSKFHWRSLNLFRALIPVPVFAKRACGTLNLFYCVNAGPNSPRGHPAADTACHRGFGGIFAAKEVVSTLDLLMQVCI